MIPGIALGVAFYTAFSWARLERWLHPIATLRAFLRERAVRAPAGMEAAPA